MSAVVTHREVERKYAVPPEFRLPDPRSITTIADIETQEPIELDATYFDTDDLALFRWGITLRRRLGGHDAGWHLKIPVRADRFGVRDELHLPDQATVPAAFIDITAPLLIGRTVQPLVTVQTTRRPYRVTTSDGAIELVDDHVTVTRPGSQPTTFREIEIELLDDTAETHHAMAELGSLLQAAGAQPSSVSKAARALGERTQQPPDVVAYPMPRPDALAADALRAIISPDVIRFLHADVDVRRDADDAVHQLRVAARRLRSTLRTFAPLFDPEWAQGLQEDLAWIAREMGTIRDSEVLLQRLVEHGASLPVAEREPVQAFVTDFLGRRRDTARSGALAALRSDRHEFLIEDLVRAVREPRFADAAFQPSDAAILPLVSRSWRRLKRAMRAVDDDPASWHRARIKAKRARYAVEALVPMYGKSFRSLAKLLAELTEELGLHQDATVAQEQLADMARSAPSDIAFGLGLLSAQEVVAADLDRANVRELWPRVKRAAKAAGL